MSLLKFFTFCRFFYKLVLLPLSLSILAACTGIEKRENVIREALDQPNIVIIYLDDSGYGDYAHHGNPTISTPTISQLAYNGTSFSQFYTSSPACSASRYSLLTGRVPGRSGLGSWVIGPDHPRYLHPNEITIAEGLKSQGYRTAMFGKWHLGSPNKLNNMTPNSLPLAHGFEQWIGTNVSHDYVNARLLTSDKAAEIQDNKTFAGYKELVTNLPSNIALSEQLTALYTDKVVEFIDKNKEVPFFAYVAFNQPHLGLHVSPNFKGKSRRGLLGDVMAEIDHSVARVLAAIDKAGIQKNTLVVFSSDNGPWVKFHRQDHRRYGNVRLDVGYAMPFRDGKGSNWEGGHRVPGIFYWPGTIDSGKLSQAPVSTLDILPTIFSLTDTPLPADRTIDGRDISGYLNSKLNKQPSPFKFIYSGIHNEPTAIRVGAWKLLTSTYSQLQDDYGYEASLKSPLLFNVEQDLTESYDLAVGHPNIVNSLTKQLLDYRQNINQEGSFW